MWVIVRASSHLQPPTSYQIEILTAISPPEISELWWGELNQLLPKGQNVLKTCSPVAIHYLYWCTQSHFVH